MLIPARLNGAIAAIEQGRVAFTTFCPPDIASAQAVAEAGFDAVVFEMEHNPYDARVLKDCLQYLLSPRRIAAAGHVAPSPTPMVRLPCNGEEMNQWMAKQALDAGVYGIIWPHIRTVEQARSAVAACRYARPPEEANYEPAGRRGDGPRAAARYWGLTQPEYYERADVWPLQSDGELLVGMMCESVEAMRNLPAILKEVPGMQLVIIGEGDLSQNLGVPRQYGHPKVVEAIAEIIAVCKEHDVVCGHPHADTGNVEAIVDAGFGWVMAGPTPSFAALKRGRELTT